MRHLSSVFDVQLKHFIIDIFFERNVKKQFLNTILSFVAYKIMLPTLKIVNKTILIES